MAFSGLYKIDECCGISTSSLLQMTIYVNPVQLYPQAHRRFLNRVWPPNFGVFVGCVRISLYDVSVFEDSE
jgi:hypothetical protein